MQRLAPAPRQGAQKINPKLALAVGTAGVSFSAVFVRLSKAPSLVTASLRLLWTVAILGPYTLVRHRGEIKGLTRKDALMCAASGFFLALHFTCWFESLKHTTVASAAILVNTDVIFTSLGYALLLKGRIPKLGIPAIGITFAGSVLIAAGAGAGGGSLYGDALALLGAVFFAAYMLIGRVQRARLSTNVYTLLTYTACTVCLLLMCAATRTPLWGWGWREAGISLGLAVVCTLLGHSMFSLCLGYLSPAYVAVGKMAEPLFAAILAAFLFAEIPAPLQLAGAALVLCGILMFSAAEEKAGKKRPPG